MITIDLSLPAEKRWIPILKYKRQAKSLLKNACEEIDGLGFIKKMIYDSFLFLYGEGSKYHKELEFLSKNLNISVKDILVCHLIYELSQSTSYCTSVAIPTNKFGMVHARNLDWPLKGLDKYTIPMKFINGKKSFISISFPGYIGALSGMVPGQYSASINQAPTSIPNPFGWSASFALRRLFETCYTYNQAIEFISNIKSIYPFFVHVVGKTHSKVIAVKPYGGNYIYSTKAITNHYPDDENYYDVRWEENGELYCTDSIKRLDIVTRKTENYNPKQLKNVFKILESVSNDDTMQSIIFCPKTGDYQIG